ncbi:MAG: beta-lactamase family protein [Pyrinomonadaceae bacterium]|nr:beta-lactamase family protein [Pyrinomonadaceae bacterium]
MAEINGKCDKKFARMSEMLNYSLDCGDDIGASVAVFIEGEPVVDIWGGYFDGTFTRKWERDTIICNHSTTKTMTAMAALVLADRGELDLNAPVAKYWTEFAQNGKENILVRHLLGHTSGLAGWTEDVTWEDVYDLEKSSDMLAKQAPWWEPGTASGYHGVTQGHLVSGVIQRITGKTLGQFFADEIAKPLGADYHIGTPAECDDRVAPFVQAIPEVGLSGNPMLDRIAYNPNLNPVNSSSIPWRRAEIGAANGHGNARAVATIHSALVAEKVNGVNLLSEKGRLRVLEEQSNGVDLLLGIPIRWGMGFCLESPLFANELGHRLSYWGGNGGSLGYVDLDERMTISFVMNRWIEGAPYEFIRYQRLVKTVYECLAEIGQNKLKATSTQN